MNSVVVQCIGFIADNLTDVCGQRTDLAALPARNEPLSSSALPPCLQLMRVNYFCVRRPLRPIRAC